MNTIWSSCVQSTGTLYESRCLRFSDVFKKKYKDIFNIDDKGKILEIGCGPGALAESLARWYPGAQIFGIDRDSNFIDFAGKAAPHICFCEGDATALTFEDESFDVTISNTVSEHIEPSRFYGEQYRVLRENGVCLLLSARKGINIPAPCILEETEFEREFWQRTSKLCNDALQKYAVCAYPQNEAEMPLAMEKYGFREVSADYITVNLTPDDPKYSKEIAYAMINANRRNDIDGISNILNIAGDIVSRDEIEEMKRLVNKKYDKRLSLYDAGIKQWDTNMSVTMIIRGVK